jgi:hypothetical protein
LEYSLDVINVQNFKHNFEILTRHAKGWNGQKRYSNILLSGLFCQSASHTSSFILSVIHRRSCRYRKRARSLFKMSFRRFYLAILHLLGCILGPDVWPDGGAGQDDPGLQLQRTPLHGDGQQTTHSQAGTNYS